MTLEISDVGHMSVVTWSHGHLVTVLIFIERDDGEGGECGRGVQEGGPLPDGGHHPEDHQVSNNSSSLFTFVAPLLALLRKKNPGLLLVRTQKDLCCPTWINSLSM